MKKLNFIFLIFGFLFFSCTDFLNENSDSSESSNNLSSATVAFKGRVEYSGAVPYELLELNNSESTSRSASYKIETSWIYFATATSGNDTFSGTFGSGSQARTFEIPLATGKTWTITCGIKDEESTLLSDTFSVTTSVEEPVISHTFFVKPSAEGKGTINLSMTVPETVKSIKAECSDSDWPSTLASATPSGTSATFTASNVKSGTYEVTYNFYDSINILQYTTTQTINVFDNLTTSRWYSSSSESSPINSDGTFEVTQALINAQKRTIFYVGNTSLGDTSVTGSDTTGTGSPYAPFSTITKACSFMTDSSVNYKIFICGTVTGTQNIPSSLTGKVKSLTVQGYNGLENGVPKDSLNGNNGGTTLTISTTVPVTIKNLMITGGSAENGGGINSIGTLSLADGCLVSGNTATKNGGGVYSTGTMFMYGSAVIGDSTKDTAATNSDSGYSNKATECGGGIYSSGNLYLGYSAANTESTLTGGVFYNYAFNTGGIYQLGTQDNTTNSTFTLKSGSVSYNSVRGIYTGKCTFNMTGGTINENTAPNKDGIDPRGGGLYAGNYSNDMISGGSITSNVAGTDGGGIYIADWNSTTVVIEGGTISGNSASGNGNGIAVMNSSFKMQGGALVDSNNDVYLASGKKILVTGKLTAQTQPIAKITPEKWERGTTIVQTSGTNIESLKKDSEYDYTNYFALSDTDWVTKLSTDNKSITIDAPIYVAGQNSETNPVTKKAGSDSNKGTKSSPFATIEKACTEMKNKDTEYTILIDGEVTGTQTIPGTLKSDGTGSYNAKSVTLSGATGNTSDILNGNKEGTTLTINTSVPVTIKNLKITGGSGTYGGGIYLGSGSNVTLSEATVTKNESKSYGGGIAVVCATLTIDKSSITENKTTKEDKGVGGGIAIVGDETVTDKVTAKVTMKAGSVISGNSLYPNKNGGGVALYIGKTQFTMEGGEISGNTAYSGGGVSMWNDAEFIFKDGKISGNISTHTSGSVGGGGIYICGKASLVMSGGEISGNKAKDYGGGVAFADNETTQSFTMTGGVIKNNTLTSTSGLGKGIFVNGTFKMSGDAIVDSSNDVLLTSEKHITLAGAPSGTSPIATITPLSWTRGTTIIKADGTNVQKLTDYKAYFALTDADWSTKLSSDEKSLLINAPIYVAGTDAEKNPVCGVAGSDTDGDGSKSYPYATIDKATLLVKNENFDYTILIDGTLSSGQSLIASTSFKATSLTIAGATSNATIDVNKNATALTIENQSIPITILNLTITKGTGLTGGGISIPNTGTILTLGDGTEANKVTITNSDSQKGGGIYNAGTLTIKNYVTITDNNATDLVNVADGAGIYNAGTLIMEGGSITNNLAKKITSNSVIGDGGGILNTGTFTFSGGSISGNTAGDRGGGIYNDGGTIYMCGSAIIGDKNATDTSEADDCSNKAANRGGGGIYGAGSGKIYIGYKDENTIDSDFTGGIYSNYAVGDGGGICAKGDTEIYIAGGTISYNAAGSNGGGISTEKLLTMSAGTLSANKADSNGGGVYLESGSFNISGSAYIPYDGETGKNDVYLNDKPITIAGAITLPEGASSIATIIPSDYTKTILELGTNPTPTTTLAKEVGKFRIIPQAGETSLGTGIERGLDSTGKYSATSLLVTVGENSVSDVRTAINTLISNSTESLSICFTDDFKPTVNNNEKIMTISSGKDITISAASSSTFTFGDSSIRYKYLFDVQNNAKLTLGENIIIDGGANNQVTDGINLNSGSELILDGAEIINCGYDGAGYIIQVKEGATLRIKGNTKIHGNRANLMVEGGTVYMEGGEFYENGNNSQNAGIVMKNNGKFIKTGGRIYNNTGYRGKWDVPSQVQFYSYYDGGWWGTSEDNLTHYGEKNTSDLYFNTESDVESMTTRPYR